MKEYKMIKYKTMYEFTNNPYEYASYEIINNNSIRKLNKNSNSMNWEKEHVDRFY